MGALAGKHGESHEDTKVAKTKNSLKTFVFFVTLWQRLDYCCDALGGSSVYVRAADAHAVATVEMN